MIRANRHARCRPGLAAIWALVVLSVATALTATAIAQFAVIRKQIDADRGREQALWLARSGIELAAAGLLANPTGYSGETISPIPGGEIKITAARDPKVENVFRVQSEVQYRDGSRLIERSDRRSFKVVKADKSVRLEVVPEGP